jgi:hypothetical protein
MREISKQKSLAALDHTGQLSSVKSFSWMRTNSSKKAQDNSCVHARVQD